MDLPQRGISMEAMECTGPWWLPGKENDWVAGTLRISESGSLQLFLTGTLEPMSPAGPKTHQIILGSVDKSPAGNNVTLVGCMLTGSSFGSFAGVREKYYASRGYFGAHLPNDAAFAFKFASVRAGGLTEWAHNFSGISVDYRPPSAVGEKVPFASYTRHAPVTSEVPDGKAILGVGLSWSDKGAEVTITEKAILNIELDAPKTADAINGDYVYPLQNLMTFVCDRAQKVESFIVKPEYGRLDPEKNPEIRVIGPRVEPEEGDEDEESKPVRWHQMLFTLKEIDFPSFYRKWMQITDRYAPACSIFFGLKYGPPAYIDMTFLGIVQSLHLYYSQTEEGLKRRAEEERRLRQALSSLEPPEARWIVSHLGDNPYPTFESELSSLIQRNRLVMYPLMSARVDRFVTEVMNTLYYLIHRDSEADRAASHGSDFYWLLETLRVLFKASFLGELGFSEEQVLTLFERNPLYKHMRELESAREAQRSSSSKSSG
jgi:hypothetical protein